MDTDGDAELIELISGAALDEAHWPSIMEGVAEAIGAGNAALVRHDHMSGRAQGIEVRLDPAAHGLFVDYYSMRNIFRQHSEIDDAYARRAVTVRPHVRDLLLRSEYYNDFLKPFDMAHLAWVFLDRDGSDVAIMTVGRSEQHDAFDQTEIDRLTRLMPHLMRSYAISRRLGGIATNGALAEYLDPLPHGVVLLDALGRIMYSNRAATAIAAAADGIRFSRDGMIATAHAANDRLQAAIHQAADPYLHPRANRGVSLPRPSGARPYVVAVCPLNQHAAPLLFGRPSVLVEIRDLTAANPAADAWLADCLDLTAAEARVAGLLLAGMDPGSIAARLAISVNTVRVHLTHLMNKTDTHRQAELVQLLGRVAALQRPIH